MRDEMIGAVVKRAIEHPEFRKQLFQNPEQALGNHGFVLESEELSEIHKIKSSIGDSNDNDVETRLVALAEEYGIRPEKLMKNGKEQS